MTHSQMDGRTDGRTNKDILFYCLLKKHILPTPIHIPDTE